MHGVAIRHVESVLHYGNLFNGYGHHTRGFEHAASLYRQSVAAVQHAVFFPDFVSRKRQGLTLVSVVLSLAYGGYVQIRLLNRKGYLVNACYGIVIVRLARCVDHARAYRIIACIVVLNVAVFIVVVEPLYRGSLARDYIRCGGGNQIFGQFGVVIGK